jgi:hypothetical protein
MPPRLLVIWAIFIFGAKYASATSYVYDFVVQSDSTCKSGIAFQRADNIERRCIAPFNKVDLSKMVGQPVKARVEYGHLIYKVKEINPNQAAGTKKGSFVDHLSNGIVATANVAIAADGGSTPPSTENPAQQPNNTEPSPTIPTTQTDGVNRYTAGINYCVKITTDAHGGAVFHNVCTARVNVWWASAAGYGSLTIKAGDQGTGELTNTSGAAKGNFEYYVCSEHYNAVDEHDSPIYSPIKDFKCIFRSY